MAHSTGRCPSRPVLIGCRTGGRGPQRGRRLLDDDRRPAGVRHPGRREGDHLDEASATGTPATEHAPRRERGHRLAGAVACLAEAPPSGEPPPVVRAFFAALDLGEVADLASSDPPSARATLERRVADRTLRRSAAMLQDTITPTVIHVGNKVNVIPGTEPRSGCPDPARHGPGRVCGAAQTLAGPDVTVEAVMSLPAIEAPPIWIVDPACGGGGGRPGCGRGADDDLRSARMPKRWPGSGSRPTASSRPGRRRHPVPRPLPRPRRTGPLSAIRFGVPVLSEVVRRFAAVEAGVAARRGPTAILAAVIETDARIERETPRNDVHI